MLRHRAIFIAFACLVAFAGEAPAQSDYPSRPVRIIVNSAPGGGTDILARVITQQMSKGGLSFFVENRGGGGGIVGIEAVRNAPADGYTLLMTPSTIAVLPAVTKETRYDPTKDFTAITQVAGISNVLVVHPDVPAKTLQELIALAKSKPGALNYGSAGAGSSPHMSMELLKSMAGIDLQHIPFKGTAPAMTDVVAGVVDLMFTGPPSAKSMSAGGKLRLLAVAAPQRLPSMPDVPTVSEAGVPGYEMASWFGLLAPAKTPQPIIDRLSAETNKAVHDPRFSERMAAQGLQVVGSTPAEMLATMQADTRKWAALIKSADIKIEQ